MNVLGAHAGLFGTANYSIPVRWLREIYTHPAGVDGILYVPRMMAPSLAVVLFDWSDCCRSHRHGCPEPCAGALVVEVMYEVMAAAP